MALRAATPHWPAGKNFAHGIPFIKAHDFVAAAAPGSRQVFFTGKEGCLWRPAILQRLLPLDGGTDIRFAQQRAGPNIASFNLHF